MKIVNIENADYVYGEGTEVWFENPKEVWVLFRGRGHSLKWEFSYKGGYMLIKTPGIKAHIAPHVYLNPNTCVYLIGKMVPKNIFTGRRVKI